MYVKNRTSCCRELTFGQLRYKLPTEQLVKVALQYAQVCVYVCSWRGASLPPAGQLLPLA